MENNKRKRRFNSLSFIGNYDSWVSRFISSQRLIPKYMKQEKEKDIYFGALGIFYWKKGKEEEVRYNPREKREKYSNLIMWKFLTNNGFLKLRKIRSRIRKRKNQIDKG